MSACAGALLRGCLAMMVLLSGSYGYTAPTDQPGPAASRPSYASVSDEHLTAIAARWDDLNAQQRRALLSEVKLRMRRSGTAEPVLGTNITRRYGTVVRRSDGARATLRVEVRAVKKRPHQGFGVGFEQRAGQGRARADAVDAKAPVVRVADPEK